MLKFVFGALVGAALALAFAPKSGEELREDFSGRVNDTIEHAKDAARKVSRHARELGDQANERLHNVTDAI